MDNEVLQMLVHGMGPDAGRERHTLLGATHSKQNFGREETYDKLEQGISGTENMGDKDSSSLDRKPRKKNVTSVFSANFEPLYLGLGARKY